MTSKTSLYGIVIAFTAFAMFPFHDALVKWLVADYSIWQIMCLRSVLIVVPLLIWQGRPLLHRAVHSPYRHVLALRACVLVGAWSCFYSAARFLGLGELTTIYFASPIIVAMLAVPLLGEKVTWLRWVAIGLGFIGVIVACRPNLRDAAYPVMLALGAAMLWAFGVILVRKGSVHESVAVNVLATNSGFIILGGIMLPFHWVTPTLHDCLLFMVLGVISGAAQGLVFEAIRHAPASTIAPLEFTGLIWAFTLGYIIWNDIPDIGVFIGAGLIIVSGLIVVASEWRLSVLMRKAAAKA